MDWHSAEHSAALAAAAIARIGGDRRLESWLANNVGALKWYEGHFEEARASFERSVAIKASLLGPDSVDLAISKHNLAYTYGRLGRADEALRLIDEAQEVQRRSMQPDSIVLAEGLSDRADILLRLGRLDEAERGFREALGPFDRSLTPDDPDRAEPFAGLGLIAMARGRFAEAVRFLETALSHQKRDTPYRIAETQFNLAVALRRAGHAAGRSRELAQAALTMYESDPTYSREAKGVRVWLERTRHRRSAS